MLHENKSFISLVDHFFNFNNILMMSLCEDFDFICNLVDGSLSLGQYFDCEFFIVIASVS